MARSYNHRLLNRRVLNLVLVLVGFCLACYFVGRPLYWHFEDGLKGNASCSPCDCECPSETIISVVSGCDDSDPDMKKEMKKDITDLLQEELYLEKIVTDDTLEHTKVLTKDANRTSSKYRREADKCNVGVGTCEQMRQIAEAELRDELKLSALWEKRARELGWTEHM